MTAVPPSRAPNANGMSPIPPISPPPAAALRSAAWSARTPQPHNSAATVNPTQCVLRSKTPTRADGRQSRMPRITIQMGPGSKTGASKKPKNRVSGSSSKPTMTCTTPRMRKGVELSLCTEAQCCPSAEMIWLNQVYDRTGGSSAYRGRAASILECGGKRSATPLWIQSPSRA